MDFVTKVVLAAILALAILDTVEIYSMSGIYWDFAVNVLNARAFLTPFFYQYMSTVHPPYPIVVTPHFYIETFRDPLMPLLLTLLTIPLNGFAPVVYQIAIIFLLLASLIYFSSKTDVNLLLLALLFFNPYVLFNLFLLDGEEGLSLIIMIFTVALLFQKRWESGVLLGIAGLAKYPSLIFFPLLFLLPGRDLKLKGFAAFVVTSMPFLIVNFAYYGNPFAAYFNEMNFFSLGSSPGSSVIAPSLLTIFAYLIPALLVLAALFVSGNEMERDKAKRIDHRQKVLFAAIALGTIGWLWLSRYPSLYSTPRMGYLMYLGVALEMAVLLGRFRFAQVNQWVPDLSWEAGGFSKSSLALGFMILITVAVLGYSFVLAHQEQIFNTVGTGWIGFTTARSLLGQFNFSNCSVISNAWVYLDYNNVTAYPPTDNSSQAVTMPRLVYYTAGESPSLVSIPLGSAVLHYSYDNLILPPNASCSH